MKMSVEDWWDGTDGGNKRYCSSATLCSTYLTWTDLGSYSGPCGDRLATNGLSHRTTDIETQFHLSNVCSFSPDHLFYYTNKMAVCSQIHTKHINKMCGQNVGLLNVKLAVHIVTTGM